MTSNTIALITDSTCDIPADLIDRYNIYVQAHVLIWNGQEYRDRVDINADTFYQRLKTEKELPTTSQATVQDFTGIYQRAIEDGASELVVCTVSGALSGAYQSAVMAAKNVKVPITVHDSRGVTLSLGWQVLAAARAREAGGTAQDMVAAAEDVRRRVSLVICLNTLEYLYRGGRIGNARRLIGSMLNIKPLLTINHETGLIDASGAAVTYKKGVMQMYRHFFSSIDTSRPMHLAVLHGDAADDAAPLLERIRSEFNPVELLSNVTGPAIGIHAGPRAIALCGYSE